MSLPNKLVFVDIETTGARVSYDRIIEIGILRVENNELVDSYQTLINPEMYLSPFIENMTGIQASDLENAPTFSEVKEEIVERLGDCVFVAHNVRFDYGFIRNELKRYEIPYSAKHFCTAKLSKDLFPQHRHHNLDALIERFGFTCENRHRAFDDAKVLWDFYQAIQKITPEEELIKMLDRGLKKPSIPTTLDPKTLDDLPEQPGVYIFYSPDNVPLYVGKSVNIKERVLSHFSNDYQSTKEMSLCSQTGRIETIVTAGELGALIKESELIKTIQPLYNRQLRYASKVVIARKTLNTKGYEEVKIETVDTVDPSILDSVIGVFKSRRQAKNALKLLARDFQLCEKYLSLENSTSSCFGHKIGRCSGACIGSENPIAYNMRFASAFTKYKIKNWPFKGPIVIEEADAVQKMGERFLVNNWCFLGSIQYNEEYTDNKNTEGIFDIDTYNILRRYISSPANKKRIKTLTLPDVHSYSYAS